MTQARRKISQQNYFKEQDLADVDVSESQSSLS